VDLVNEMSCGSSLETLSLDVMSSEEPHDQWYRTEQWKFDRLDTLICRFDNENGLFLAIPFITPKLKITGFRSTSCRWILETFMLSSTLSSRPEH